MIFLQILIIFPVYQKSIFHRTLSLVVIYLIMIYIYVFTFLETLTEAPSNRSTQTEASIDIYKYNFPENTKYFQGHFRKSVLKNFNTGGYSLNSFLRFIYYTYCIFIEEI